MNMTDRPHRTPGAEGEAAPLRGLPESDRTLLIVDDDAPLCQRLARAMERRGFFFVPPPNGAPRVGLAEAEPPAFAGGGFWLGGGSGPPLGRGPQGGRPRAPGLM